MKEFILGGNTTGLLTRDGDNVNVVGGVHAEYLKGIFPASEIYTGSGRVEGTYTVPQATWDAWGQFMASRTGVDMAVISESGDASLPTSTSLPNAASSLRVWSLLYSILMVAAVTVLSPLQYR